MIQLRHILYAQLGGFVVAWFTSGHWSGELRAVVFLFAFIACGVVWGVVLLALAIRRSAAIERHLGEVVREALFYEQQCIHLRELAVLADAEVQTAYAATSERLGWRS